MIFQNKQKKIKNCLKLCKNNFHCVLTNFKFKLNPKNKYTFVKVNIKKFPYISLHIRKIQKY